MRWPLRYQILVPFTAVMLVAVLGVAALSAYLAAKRTETELAAQLDGLAAMLRESPFPFSENVLRQMTRLSGAEFIVASSDLATPANISASTLDIPASFRLDVAADAKATSTLARFDVRRTVALEGEKYFYLSTPTRPGGDGRSTVVHVLYPEARWREDRSAAIVPPLAVGGAALVVVSIVSIVISRRLSGPIALLREQVSRMAEGDYRPIERPERDDELRDLVESANSLAAQLDQLHQVIRRTERLAVLGQLSGGLAHELRNSIAGARLAVQLHQRACDDRDPESLAVALRQLELTESQLRRFLAVGKPSTPSRTRFDPAELAEEVATLVRPAARHRDIAVEVSGPPQAIAIDADREQVRQLLVNLLLNAVEAAGGGGRVGVALVTTPGGELRIRVVDSGPGPPADVADRLFEPFVTTKPEGVGLGLAVAQQIAAAHGGTIALDTAADETCFEVVLPCIAGRQQPAACKAASPDRPSTEQPHHEIATPRI